MLKLSPLPTKNTKSKMRTCQQNKNTSQKTHSYTLLLPPLTKHQQYCTTTPIHIYYIQYWTTTITTPHYAAKQHGSPLHCVLHLRHPRFSSPHPSRYRIWAVWLTMSDTYLHDTTSTPHCMVCGSIHLLLCTSTTNHTHHTYHTPPLHYILNTTHNNHHTTHHTHDGITVWLYHIGSRPTNHNDRNNDNNNILAPFPPTQLIGWWVYVYKSV